MTNGFSKKMAINIVTDDTPSFGNDYQPSVTWSVFIYWILPISMIAMMTRFASDIDAISGLQGNSKSTVTAPMVNVRPSPSFPTMPAKMPTIPPSSRPSKKKPTPVPMYFVDKPSSYIDAVQAINKRRLDWDNTDSSSLLSNNESPDTDNTMPNAATSGKTENTRSPSSDPIRSQLRDRIDELRNDHVADPNNLFRLIEFADALRLFDVQYHDGGSSQKEAISSYKEAIALALKEREKKVELDEETNRSLSGTVNIPDEIMLSYNYMSTDGILCSLYTSIGKVYFMANMFENAVKSYTEALGIEPLYLDALAARGSSRIILGEFEDAAKDFTIVMEKDKEGRFLDVYTGLGRILQARETAVPAGWEPMIESISTMIPALETQYTKISNADGKNMIARTLNRLMHVLFVYHDAKTNNTKAAWEFITKSYKYKMSALKKSWDAGFENQKITATKQIFRPGFWPDDVGSKSPVPIFIIGFVRSGSTLLERILDAHPSIIGTGENSVFNGRLDDIRNKIVETSLNGDSSAMSSVISSLADGVIDEMRRRWEMVSSDEVRVATEITPERFIDKMLTNYYNVGFIHMLFPNALILHVVREPMDTIWSAYKHEFPSGTLDYTSDFSSLAELYHGYRDLMDHWDKVLPERVTHVKYEDLVNDMSGVARMIIKTTSLEWDDSILEFHMKKQAVNTLSTTQVRKGVYKDSLQAWKKYETYLSPLVDLLGDRTVYNISTSVPNYVPPSVVEEPAKKQRELKESLNTGFAQAVGAKNEL